MGGPGGTVLVAGVRWASRGKDAGSADSGVLSVRPRTPQPAKPADERSEESRRSARPCGTATVLPSLLQIAPREREQRESERGTEVSGGPDPDPPAVHVGAAERPELEEGAREAARVARDQPQPVLVEGLEWQRPGRDLGSVEDRVRVQRVADRPEQPRDEPGAEEHEDCDPVRRRGEDDGAEDREGDHDHDTTRELEPWPDLRRRRPVTSEVDDRQCDPVHREHVDAATRGGPEEA